MRLAASLAVLVLAASPALAQPAMTDGGVIRDAGVPYTMQRETQGKLFFVDNTWWGAFGGTGGIDFYRFDASSKTWAKQTFTGAHVTSDSNSRSECHWDGTNLLILYSVGMAATGDGPLYLAAYTYSAPNFVPIGGFPVQVVASGAVDKNWSVVEDTNQRLWISYQTYAQYGVLSSTGTGPSGWTSFHAPIFMGNASTGVDNDLGSHGLVAFNGNIGLIWTECFNAPDNHTKFSWRADSNTDLSGSSFSPVELCQEDATYTMLTDDHVCVRSFEGQVWCVSKSNYDQNQGGFPRFTLMRRDLSGNWSHWTVKTINPTPDYSSRPIMAIDATNRLLYFFWIDSGIQYDSTPIDNPGTFSSIGTLILEAGSETLWDSTTTSQVMTANSGLMVAADRSNDGWSMFGQLSLGTPTTGPLAKITVTPNPGSVVEGGSLAFSASGSDASGNPVSISPTWTATGGTVSSTGLYKAGTTAGSFTVTATSGSVSGSATVNVTAPPVLTTIAVTPNPASVATGGKQTFTAQGKDQNGNNISATYTWSATGGTITQAGVYTAGSQTGSFGVTATSGSVSGVASVTVTAAPVLTTITVTPNPASVVAGGTQTFTAQGKDQNGNNISATYTWSATGGTITQAGVYTAGSQTGSFAVTAKSGSVSGVAGVTITAQPTPVLTTIAVTPNPASVATGGTQTFTAQGKDQNGNNMSATFTWSATGGTITQAGVYTAGSQTGSFTVTATSGSVSGSASVTVTSSSGPPPSEVIVDNDTPGWSVISGTWTLHFSSSEYGSSERTLDNGNGVSQWTASLVPGTYDVYAWWDEHYRQTTATATYTIETASGNVTLTVNQLPSSTWGVWNKLGTWTFGATGVIQVAGGINVSADAVRFTPSSSGGTPPPVLTTITVTPNPATVSAGATQTFTAQGKDQNGNNMSATFTWSATGGTITQAGVYTAGQTAGTFSVTATSGSVSGSATVNVTTNAPPPVLTTITVTPNPATVSAGASQTFTAQGKDQNGNNMSATFTWSATGGTITQAGVYTAGQTGGTFSVKATSGNVSGSATVNVTANQPPPQILTSVVVSPNPASTTPSGTVTFTAQAKDQNGNNMSETFMWTASAGTIDQSGHYTAPASTGSFTVTASSQGISGHATVNVQSALATVIVDDSDPGWTVLSGEWDQHYESLHYGPTDHVIAVGSTGTCQWKPVLATGTYDVYAWIPERDSIPSCVGAYTIVTASGNVSVSLDQNTPSYWGTFVKLGSFQLNAGTALVQLTAAANQRVSADAMEFVQTGP